MMTDYVVCEMHEVGNCTVCSGADKREARDQRAEEEAQLDQLGHVRAEYGGRCGRCHHYYPPGSVIHWDNGWVCCEPEKL